MESYRAFQESYYPGAGKTPIMAYLKEKGRHRAAQDRFSQRSYEGQRRMESSRAFQENYYYGKARRATDYEWERPEPGIEDDRDPVISKVRAALTWKERVQYSGTLPPWRADRIGLNAYGNKPADPRNWNKPKWLKKQGPLSKLT